MQKVSDGIVPLELAIPANQASSPSSEQINAYQYLVSNEDLLFNNIIQAILKEYPERRRAYDYGLEGYQDEDEAMPYIDNSEQFKMLIGLASVYLLGTTKREFSYILFNFNAAWDPEHGFNATIYKDQVIMIGDTGAGEYYARADSKVE